MNRKQLYEALQVSARLYEFNACLERHSAGVTTNEAMFEVSKCLSIILQQICIVT